MKYAKYILFIVVGVLVYGILYALFQPAWVNDASVDIFLSVILDFFIVQIIIMAYEDRQEERFKSHLQNHLRMIEQLVKNHTTHETKLRKYLDEHLKQVQNIIKNNKPNM